MKIRIGKKTYKIRPNSPAEILINEVLPILGILGFLALVGLMNSWELGLL